MTTRQNIDGGYAWVILGAGCFVNITMGMLYYSTGVVNKAVLDKMEEGVVKTSWVGSTFLGTVMMSGPLTGCITTAAGCRFTTVFGGVCMLLGLMGAFFARNVDGLIVSYGLAVGFGIGLTTTAASVSVGHYFDKLRPLASGILVSGGGCGMLIGAPLVRLLFDRFGLDGMFLILGALASHTCVAGMLLRQSLYENTIHETNNTDSTAENKLAKVKDILWNFTSVLCECSFVLYALSYGLWCFGESAFQVHLPNYAELKGTSAQNAAMLFTAMGITSTVARILAGFAGSDPAIGSLLLHTGMLGVSGAMVMLIPVFSQTFLSQMCVSAMYGLYAGGPMALLNPICVQLLGITRLASGYGMNNLFGGIGLLIGPPFAGFLFHITGDFDKSFLLAGSVIVIGSLVSLPIVTFKKENEPSNLDTCIEDVGYGDKWTSDVDAISDNTQPLMSAQVTGVDAKRIDMKKGVE